MISGGAINFLMATDPETNVVPVLYSKANAIKGLKTETLTAVPSYSTTLNWTNIKKQTLKIIKVAQASTTTFPLSSEGYKNMKKTYVYSH